MKYKSGMKINVCIPTLNRYDLLEKLINSLQQSDLKPTDIFVIDNGGQFIFDRLIQYMDDHGIQHHYLKFGENIGCAASWNWFARNTSDIRIISNDDILFGKDTIKQMVAAYDRRSILSPDNIVASNSFSCFILPSYLYEQVGEFDETISPNWGYYEDVDYSYRLRSFGYGLRGVPECSVEHAGSSTLKFLKPDEMAEHHARFMIATENYKRKWGGMPGQETIVPTRSFSS